MKKFIELIGIDENNEQIMIFINPEKISYLQEIYNQDLSTIVFLDGGQSVSVIETIDQVNDFIRGEQ